MDSKEQHHLYFSFSEGGLFHRLLLEINVYENKTKLVLFFFCLTWLPLLILSAFEGTLLTGAHPFLTDISTHVRLLLALPTLLLLGTGIDKRVLEVKRYLSDTLMSGEKQRGVFARILSDSRKLSHSAIVELALMAIVVATTIGYGKGGFMSGGHEASETWTLTTVAGKDVLSYAGRWADFVSIPIFQFLVLRWFWRYIVWTLMLFRLSKADMSLQATHPDKAGGLGILMHAQKSFSSFFVAISATAAGELIVRLLDDPGAFISIRNDVIGFIVIFLVMIFLPLLFNIRKLIKVKEDGLLRLSKTGAHLSHTFENEWTGNASLENKLTEATVDPSTMQDFDTVFVSLEEMHMVPFDLKDVIVITLLLITPYLPILIIHFSVGELLERLLGLLL